MKPIGAIVVLFLAAAQAMPAGVPAQPQQGQAKTKVLAEASFAKAGGEDWQKVIRSEQELKKELGLTAQDAAKLLKVARLDFDKTMLVAIGYGKANLVRSRGLTISKLEINEAGSTLMITYNHRYFSGSAPAVAKVGPRGAIFLLDRSDKVAFTEGPRLDVK